MDYLAAMRSFVRTADLGSFSRAAAETGVKVSTISRYVSSLEADLGAALLNRSTHGLRLTEIGRTFYEDAVRILSDIEDARALASSFNKKPQGRLKVTAPAAFARRHIVPYLSAFMADFPAISIELDLSDAHVDLIEAGMDLAIRIGSLEDSTLVARKLADHRRILCASPGFLKSTAPIAHPKELAKCEGLIFSLQSRSAWIFKHSSSGESVPVKVSGRLSINDSEALLTCAVDGLGIAMLPTWLVYSQLARGSLVVVLPEWAADFDRAIWAVYPPKKVVSPKVRAFIGFLEDRLRRPVYWDAHQGQDQSKT